MTHAVAGCLVNVQRQARTVHRLQKEMVERERFELFRGCVGLWEDELELVARSLNERSARLGADANPIQ
jgi:hypothetical protein